MHDLVYLSTGCIAISILVSIMSNWSLINLHCCQLHLVFVRGRCSLEDSSLVGGAIPNYGGALHIQVPYFRKAGLN